VAIPTGIMAELKKYKALQNEEKLKAGMNYKDHNLAFCTRLGSPLEPRNFNRKFGDLITMSKITNFNLHGLRHYVEPQVMGSVTPKCLFQHFFYENTPHNIFLLT
jgi:hypothetical protein